jgi:hypothetical protein
MQIGEFLGLNLVGGTSLALQIGHRKSIDLDLFGYFEIDEYHLSSILGQFDSVKLLNKSANIKTFLINEIKVDFVNYPYHWLEPCQTINGIRLATIKDITAMKLSAITGRGTKKDFIDIFSLFDYFSLAEMLQFYRDKFPDGTEFLVLKSLTYFEDAEKEQIPFMLKEIDWEAVKSKIVFETKTFLNSGR